MPSLVKCTALFIYVCYFWSSKTDSWRAPWNNRISSTSMKLRKSLVKPVTRQNISSCLVLSPEIVTYDAFNVILWTSADICVVPIYVSSDICVVVTISGERTEQLDIFCRVTGFTSDFRPPQTSVDVCFRHDDLWWKNQTTSCNRFWRTGCNRLEYVDIRLVY